MKAHMSINLDSIRTGLTGSTEIMVGTRDTAPHVGSGRIKVLATPVLVMLLEESALNAVEGLLPEESQRIAVAAAIVPHAVFIIVCRLLPLPALQADSAFCTRQKTETALRWFAM